MPRRTRSGPPRPDLTSPDLTSPEHIGPATARTRQELLRTWETLVHTPAGRSLHIATLGPEGHFIGPVVEVSDLPARPSPGEAAQLERFLEQLLDGPAAPRGRRFAFLVARPGRSVPGEQDRRWAAVLYDACTALGAGCATVHVTGDDGPVPVTPEAVADLLDDLEGALTGADLDLVDLADLAGLADDTGTAGPGAGTREGPDAGEGPCPRLVS